MVYPHNNDLGKNPPPKSKPSPDASFLHMIEKDMEDIKAAMDQYKYPMIPHWDTTIKKQAVYDQIMGKSSGAVFHHSVVYEPELIKGAKFDYWTLAKNEPVSMPIKTGQLHFDISGLTDKTQGAIMQFMIPPEGMTESQLREFLMKHFQTVTEKIIDEIKKEVL